MSRSGYSDEGDDNQWALICWRGAVASALRGKRGQAFLKELLAALDALPEKRLIEDDLERTDGSVCALGALGKARGTDMSAVYADDPYSVAAAFAVPRALAAEIMYTNDEYFGWKITPEERFAKVRAWVKSHIKQESTNAVT